MSADLMIAAGVVCGTVLFGWAVFGAVLALEWLGYRALRCLSRFECGYRPPGYLSHEQGPRETQAGGGLVRD
jgi:hypothetical protein